MIPNWAMIHILFDWNSDGRGDKILQNVKYYKYMWAMWTEDSELLFLSSYIICDILEEELGRELRGSNKKWQMTLIRSCN